MLYSHPCVTHVILGFFSIMSKYIDQIQNYTDRIYKKSGGNSNNSNNNRNRRNNHSNDDDNDDYDDFEIKTTSNAIIIGASSHGNIALDRRKFEVGGTRALIIGQTGSGKSFATRNIIEQLYSNKTGVIVILDPEGDYYTLRSKFDFVILGLDEDTCDIVINEENASDLTLKMMLNEINIIVDLSDADDDKIRQEIATLMIQTILQHRKIAPPITLIVEEAAIFAKKSMGTTSVQNMKCTDALKKIARLGRKGAVCTFFCTQRITHLHKDISAECNTYILGKCNDPADIERNAKFLHLSGKNIPDFENLKYEFYAYGEGFDHYDQKNIPIKFKSNKPYSTHHSISRRDPGSFPKPESEVVKKWISLMKSIKDLMKESVKNKAASTDKPILALVPSIAIDSSSFIPITPPKPTKNWEDEADDKMFGNLSDSCEVCGKTAIAHNRCEKHADYDPRLKDFDDEDDDDNDDDDESDDD